MVLGTRGLGITLSIVDGGAGVVPFTSHARRDKDMSKNGISIAMKFTSFIEKTSLNKMRLFCLAMGKANTISRSMSESIIVFRE